ncbi:MAG TPA: glycosyltransferase [Opitutaceae bacterium]
MRLTHIVPSLDRDRGGPSVSVPRLSGALAAVGHAVEVLSTHGATPPVDVPAGAAAVRTFPRGWPAFLQRSSEMRRHIGRHPAEIFHHHALWLPTLHYAHEGARRHGVPLVISPRGMMTPWSWQRHRLRKRVAEAVIHPGAFAAARGWHATSDDEAGEIRALGFRQPICVAPNGIEAPSPQGVAAARAHWLTACPEAAGRRTALFYSRFHAKKRVLELIDLWLAQAPAEWLLLLVGIPEMYPVAELEALVERKSGRGRIRVFDGSGAPPPYPVAEYFLLPTFNENFGLVIAEALAHGVPALVTDTTPWRAMEAVGAGWCVPWETFGATVQRACALSPEELRARGATGRAWVLANYSWAASARVLGEFYSTLTKAS